MLRHLAALGWRAAWPDASRRHRPALPHASTGALAPAWPDAPAPAAVVDGPAVQAMRALLLRHGASHWDMARARPHPDAPAPAANGQALRAVADEAGDAAREMRNWITDDDPAGRRPPALRQHQGRWGSEHGPQHSWGFWCRTAPHEPGGLTPPRRPAPFHLGEAHFAIVVLAVRAGGRDGVVFQASHAEGGQSAELRIEGGHAQARWHAPQGDALCLRAPAPLVPGRPTVLTLRATPRRQQLRIGGDGVAQAQAALPEGRLDQLLIGWGYRRHRPDAAFEGLVFATVTGRGEPSDMELALIEQHLLATAGRR